MIDRLYKLKGNRYLLILLAFTVSALSFGYDFEVDGIYYSKVNQSEVSVVCKKNGEATPTYGGNLTIPSKVNYSNLEYKVTSIGHMAFYNCSLQSINLPNTITSINEGAFGSCKRLVSINIPESVTSISSSAFSQCNSLEKVSIPSSVTSIGSQVFYDCNNLTSISIPNSVTTIGSGVFWNCTNLTTITLPSTLQDIPDDMCEDCWKLTSITIPQSVNRIGKGAFSRCLNLTSITIPSGVTFIGASAFSGCQQLSSVVSEIKSPYSIGADTFNGISKTATLYVPKGTLTNYQSANGWHEYFASIEELADKYSLTISSKGNGSVSYNGESIRETSKSYTLTEGTKVTISINPDNGYKVKSIKVNGSSVNKTDSYTSVIDSDTKVEVEFEAIPPTTYTFSISASGSGSASYNGESIRGTTKSYTVNEGTSISVSFNPDSGYRIKSLKVNNSGVSASSSYSATINANTSIEVEFEAIPPTTYTLSIKASGNGSASYNGESIRGTTKSYTVNEGTKLSVSFNPDSGYRIKSLKVNNSGVSASSSYSTTINANMTIEVEFEAIPETPPATTTYTLSIKASGNGSAAYSGESIRNTTKSYTVNAGTGVTVSFNADSGYRIKSVKVNGSSVSTTGSYNLTVNSNTTVEVEFEAIPETPPATTTYILSIKASGNGTASYSGVAIRNTTKSFTVNAGAGVTISFNADNGYQIKSLKVDGKTVSAVGNYNLTVNSNTTVVVEFEEIPVNTYTLSIKTSGNGVVSYNSESIRNASKSYSLNEGSTAVISFTADNGNRIKTVKVNDRDVTSELSNNSFTLTNINSNNSVEAVFEEVINAIVDNGITYQVASMDNRTIRITDVCSGLYMLVPEKVSYQNQEWLVTGIDDEAFNSNENLAAIIWEPQMNFTGRVNNPNLLLYVKDKKYAPSDIKNVVVGEYASSITLADAKSGNNFYCPRAFTAQSITYSHRYRMKTGIDESRGWETIALPFDVQKMELSGKGEIKPFANWKDGDSAKPFWLYQLSSSGFVEADGIKANTPYIISMPNNDKYVTTYCLSGDVIFSAENVKVSQSDNIQISSYSDRTFVPNFATKESNDGCFALNVNNDYEIYQGGENEGSRFIRNLRQIHPFEAYMTSSSNTRSIGIFDDMNTTTSLKGIAEITGEQVIRVYDLSGKLLKIGCSPDNIRQELPAGVYIINNRKVVIK